MEFDLEKVYAEHSKYVYNIALRMLKNRGDAQDVMQEVFIKLQSCLGSFNGDSSLKTFIYRMTVNKSIDLIRKERSMADKAQKSFPGMSQEPADRAVMLYDLLGRLSDDYRATLLLYEVAGFSQKEIGVILKVSTGTVKSRISRSINMLASIIKEEGA